MATAGWKFKDMNGARVIVLSEMHNVTACRHAIRDHSLVRCKKDSMNVLMFAMTLMFQGVHNVSYLIDHNLDVGLNGPVLSQIHTNKTADTLYGYMVMTPERYTMFGMTQAFGVRSVGIIRRMPQKPLFQIDFKGISAGVHWTVYALLVAIILTLVGLRALADRVHDKENDVWRFITQMIPDWDAPPMTDDPGLTGRLLRGTVGVGTLLIVAYYQSLLLQYLLVYLFGRLGSCI
jgi:hypothetical protein